MFVKRFTVLSLTLAGVLSVPGVFIGTASAETAGQWNDNSGSVAVSQNLQWKRLPAKTVKPSPIQHSPIQQVQYQEPIQPPNAEEQKPIEPPRANNRYTDSAAKPAAQPVTKPAETIIAKPAEKTFAATPVPVPLPAAPKPAEDLAAKTKTGKAIRCPDDAGFKSIREISVDIRPNSGELPEECPLKATSYIGRHFGQTCFQWKASAVCTKAAYFEDVQLERYGHSICPVLQPVISGAKFFATVPMLPYKMGITPPNECVYTLGHYRVGNCAPYMLDPFPISIRAIAFEAAAVGGAIAIIP